MSEEDSIIEFIKNSLQNLCESCGHAISCSRSQSIFSYSSQIPDSSGDSTDQELPQSIPAIESETSDDSSFSYKRSPCKRKLVEATAQPAISTSVAEEASLAQVSKPLPERLQKDSMRRSSPLNEKVTASSERMKKKLALFASSTDTSMQKTIDSSFPLKQPINKPSSNPNNLLLNDPSPASTPVAETINLNEIESLHNAESVSTLSSIPRTEQTSVANRIPSKTAALQKLKFFQSRPLDGLNKFSKKINISLSGVQKDIVQSDALLKFSNKIGVVHDISDENQEDHLNLTVHKADFLRMRVVGQFNRGFIVVVHGNNLFIIDQHASDEKFNYEHLKSNLVINSQDLVLPKKLDLAATEETVLIDHIDLIRRKGFGVAIDLNQRVGNRCTLLSVPTSKNVIFDTSGKFINEDLDL